MTRHARRLRKEGTPAERNLWDHLKGSQLLGLKFRRQQPLDNFVADFFCPSIRLIIEIDGDSHEGREQKDLDRQRYFEKQGLAVLRFQNSDVYENLDEVLEAIKEVCEKRMGN